MFQFLSKEISDLYGEDKKKLRTSTVLYGQLGEEGRWHTQLQPPLSIESITQLEAELKQEFPTQYKTFLSMYNGCYLFDLLRIAGKKPDTFKGMTIEEQVNSPFHLEYMQYAHLRKRTPKSHFIFADSIVKNTYYVIDMDERILEVDFRTKKIIKTYEDLKTFLFEIILEGNKNMKKGIFFEFE